MKTTPTLHTLQAGVHEITRSQATEYLRRERAQGKVQKFTWGYFLESQTLCVRCPKAEPYREPVPFALSMRLTHKYVTGWDNLDKWHDMGTAIVERVKAVRWDDCGEACRQLLIVKADAPSYRPGNVMRAIAATLASSCRCEHDCCGCVSRHAHRIRPLCGDRYAVLMSGCRNI